MASRPERPWDYIPNDGVPPAKDLMQIIYPTWSTCGSGWNRGGEDREKRPDDGKPDER